MSDENEKTGGGKLLRGLIIGGAVASVLGLHLAPKKTKKALKKKAKELLEKVENKLEELEDNIEE